MTVLRLVWAKLLHAAGKDPNSDLGQLVLAMEAALQEHHSQPLEASLRLLAFDGPSLRVSVEDLGQLIHTYSNVIVANQGLQHDVHELTERLTLLEKPGGRFPITCPRCNATVEMRPSSLPPRRNTPLG